MKYAIYAKSAQLNSVFCLDFEFFHHFPPSRFVQRPPAFIWYYGRIWPVCKLIDQSTAVKREIFWPLSLYTKNEKIPFYVKKLVYHDRATKTTTRSFGLDEFFLKLFKFLCLSNKFLLKYQQHQKVPKLWSSWLNSIFN